MSALHSRERPLVRQETPQNRSVPVPPRTLLRPERLVSYQGFIVGEVAPMNTASEPRWYAVRTHPQKERTAEVMLRQRGVEAFVPLHARYRKRSRHCRKKLLRFFPTLTGYVLIRAQTPGDLWTAMELSCTSFVVGFNNRPAPLCEASVKRLRDMDASGMLDAAETQRRMKTHREYSVGDLVEFDHGGMVGFTGKVVNLTCEIATIRSRIFNADRDIAVPVDAIVKAA